MSSLYDESSLPTSVEVSGKEYEFDSDFRTWIKFDTLLSDEDIPDREKIQVMHTLIFPALPSRNMFSFLMWFYLGGNCPEKGTNKGSRKNVRCYSFEYDEALIFSAFMQAYHMDLSQIPYLHWWKFRALFYALPEDTKLVKVMGYRSIEIDKKNMSSERVKFLTEMKKIYKLPKSLSEVQRIERMKKMLDTS